MNKEQFESTVEMVPEAGCWIWMGAISGKYGATPAQILAHRFSYELYKGAIPPGLFVLHRCDNRLCVNPNHLYVGTHKDNVIDALMRDRYNPHNRVKTVCFKGHPLSGDNLYIIPSSGTRQCKICRLERKIIWRAKRRNLGLSVT